MDAGNDKNKAPSATENNSTSKNSHAADNTNDDKHKLLGSRAAPDTDHYVKATLEEKMKNIKESSTSYNSNSANSTPSSPQSSHNLTSPPKFNPTPFFFYGSLMDITRLTRVLDLLPHPPPILTPAKISGWKVKLWGPYPALVPSSKPQNAVGPQSVVEGMVFMIEKEEYVERLKRYETKAYRMERCKIQFLDGTGREVDGKVFVWDKSERQLREGVWVLDEWKSSGMWGEGEGIRRSVREYGIR